MDKGTPTMKKADRRGKRKTCTIGRRAEGKGTTVKNTKE